MTETIKTYCGKLSPYDLSPCPQEAVYLCRIQYGCREEKDFYEIYLCDEHMVERKKECKDWYYIFGYNLLPGKEEIARIKKRGRPKN